LRFIEVKGRIRGADEVTVTRNEILTALNKPEDFVLAIVSVPAAEFAGDAWKVHASQGAYSVEEPRDCTVRYIRRPFQKEPDFGETKSVYSWKYLWDKGEEPS
jgi:hypothetical protein